MNQATYQKLVAKAIHYFWGSRQRALEAKLAKGLIDQGNRGGATAGKNLDGFAAMIAAEVKKVGPRIWRYTYSSNSWFCQAPSGLRSNGTWC